MAKRNTRTRHDHRQDGYQDEELGPFLIGAAIGGLVGAVAAFWFAPQSGRDTRHEIQEKGGELRDDIEKVAADARRRVEGESLDDSIREGKEEARRYQEMMQR